MTDLTALNAITDDIIGSAIKVHKEFGPGLLHSVYLPCLAQDLVRIGREVEVEKPIPLKYGDVTTDCAYRIDMMVDGQVIVEVKCIEKFAPIHSAQMLTYLRLTGCPVGLLINFNVTVLTQGLRRVVNNLRDEDGNLA
jgi:GxxExxY protein